MTPHASKTWMNIGFHSIFSSFFKYIFGYLHVFILFFYIFLFVIFMKILLFFLNTMFKHFCQWMMRIYSHAFAIALHPKFRLCHIVILFHIFCSRHQKVPHNMLFTHNFSDNIIQFVLITHKMSRLNHLEI